MVFFLRFGFAWPRFAFLLGFEIGAAIGVWIFTMSGAARDINRDW